MKIHLKDFRTHYDESFEFAEDVLILITGDSGKGKSSVVDAIRWCLYGTLKKVSSFDKKKCSVRIEDGDIEITRSTSPALLKIKDGKDVYEGDEAQGVINRIYHTENIYLAACYLAQMSRNILLTDTKDERMKLFRSIAMDEEEVEEYKEKIKKAIKDIKIVIDDLKTKYDIDKAFLDEFNNKHKNLEVSTTITCDIEEIKQKLRVAEENLILKNKQDKELAAIKKELFELGEIIDITERKSKLGGYEITKIKDRERKKKLLEELPECEEDNTLEEKRNKSKEKENLTKQYGDLKEYKIKLEEWISSVKIPVSCPSCNKDLVYDPTTESLEKVLIKKKKDKTVSYDPTWKTTLEKINSFVDLDLEASSVYAEKLKLLKKRKKILKELDGIKDVDETDVSVDEVEEIKKIEERNQKILKFQSLKEHLETQIIVVDGKMNEYKEVIKTNKENEKIKKLIIKKEKLEKKFISSKTKYENKKKELDMLLLLQSNIKKAEILALEKLINHVNKVLAEILNEIFDDQILVSFSTVRTLKSGKEKNEFNIKINYKGFDYDSIKQLSGGELDRLSFAITLAMNKITNSRIIILDECMNSLDAELRIRVLEILKTNKSKITICINHEVIKGFFGKIVEIE